MPIEDYFKRNDISEEKAKGINEEHERISRIKDDSKYYPLYFNSDLDNIIESMDIDSSKVLFDAILKEAKNFSDLLEPCSQSGLLGCYIASELPNSTYKGIDICKEGVNKAKTRTTKNKLSSKIFDLQDLLEYTQEHEAVVGRYVVNGLQHDINKEMLDALNRTSKNIILIQPVQAKSIDLGVTAYLDAFKQHGYSTEVVCKPKESQATGAYNFVLKATKN